VTALSSGGARRRERVGTARLIEGRDGGPDVAHCGAHHTSVRSKTRFSALQLYCSASIALLFGVAAIPVLIARPLSLVRGARVDGPVMTRAKGEQ
jgi:hypothetical protein